MTPFARVSRYWHTLRYLKPVQLWGRLAFRLLRPRVDVSPPPPRRAVAGPWVTPAARRPSMLGPMRWRFLNETRELTHWDDDGIPRLWLYNLHYFDDLTAEGAGEREHWHQAAIAHWIRDNAPGKGPGWEPYPTSQRIVNWIKFALAGNILSPEALHSLAVQTRWLMGRTEWHLLGNHLFLNGKALVFAGMFFEGAEAEKWLRRGQEILSGQFGEQVLPDGGQFERSPMYHALAVEDVLDLFNLARAFGSREWPEAAEIMRMRHWLAATLHPDGEISFFNDAVIGIAPSPAALERYARLLGQPALGGLDPVTVLADSGYVRVEHGPATAILDLALLGPDYLPAHGHADTLSFEMSWGNQRLFVNSGTSLYGSSAERLRQRGTAAHNTLVLNGLDSSEVWGGFRVARRARPIDVAITNGATGPSIAATHTGYAHLPGSPLHRRHWHFEPDEIRIKDRVLGNCETAEAYFHFHPDIQVSGAKGRFDLALPDGSVLHLAFDGGTARLADTIWHPEFGLSIPNKTLIVTLAGLALTTRLSW